MVQLHRGVIDLINDEENDIERGESGQHSIRRRAGESVNSLQIERHWDLRQRLYVIEDEISDKYESRQFELIDKYLKRLALL